MSNHRQMSNGQAKVPPIPWPKASSRATRAVVVANLAVAQPASSRDYSEEHAGRCVEPLLGAGGAIRGSGPRALWLRHCKPPDLGCVSLLRSLESEIVKLLTARVANHEVGVQCKYRLQRCSMIRVRGRYAIIAQARTTAGSWPGCI